MKILLNSRVTAFVFICILFSCQKEEFPFMQGRWLVYQVENKEYGFSKQLNFQINFAVDSGYILYDTMRWDFWYKTAPPGSLNFGLDPVFFQTFDFINVPYELFGWDLVYNVEKVDKKVLKVTTANSWIMNNMPPSHFVYYFRRE